jgi:hypothetical protein
MMLEEFTSPLVADLKSGNNVVQRGDVTVKLAQDFGFCWGVERAVAMSFQVACCSNLVYTSFERGFIVLVCEQQNRECRYA